MTSWLTSTVNELKSKGKKYYYVQHDPLVSFKKNKKTVFLKLIDILTILIEYPPIAILCADTHNYQKGTLEYLGVKIHQYIVGTGGAHPDYVKTTNTNSHQVTGVKYTMDSYIPGYGYLEITPDTNQFIKVSDWRPFEGKGGKYHNKKRKKRLNIILKRQIKQKNTRVLKIKDKFTA